MRSADVRFPGEWRTSVELSEMSAFDPKLTFERVHSHVSWSEKMSASLLGRLPLVA
jgi:hypothetical protein